MAIPIKQVLPFKEVSGIDVNNMASSSRDPKRIDRAHQLDSLELTGSGARDTLIREVKAFYEKGEIKKLSDAKQLIKLLQENKLTEFDTKFSVFTHAKNIRTIEAASSSGIKRAAEEATEVKDDGFKIVRKSSKSIVRIKNKKSELPTFELEFLHDYNNFNSAWSAGVKRLITLAESRIKEKKNIKLVIGAEIVITKPVEDDSVGLIIYAHTSPESAYSESGVAAIVRGKKGG